MYPCKRVNGAVGDNNKTLLPIACVNYLKNVILEMYVVVDWSPPEMF